MTDLVERLRACHGIISSDPECYCEEAAAEIDRLTELVGELDQEISDWKGRENERIAEQDAEIERLRAALESLTKDPDATLDEPDPDWEVIIKMRAIARAALEPKP